MLGASCLQFLSAGTYLNPRLSSCHAMIYGLTFQRRRFEMCLSALGWSIWGVPLHMRRKICRCMYTYLFVYVYKHTHICTHRQTLSLSLYIYIYTYIYTHIQYVHCIEFFPTWQNLLKWRVGFSHSYLRSLALGAVQPGTALGSVRSKVSWIMDDLTVHVFTIQWKAWRRAGTNLQRGPRRWVGTSSCRSKCGTDLSQSFRASARA